MCSSLCLQFTPIIRSIRSQSNDYLQSCARLLEIDDFIENLWKIHLAVKKEGYAQVSHSVVSPGRHID